MTVLAVAVVGLATYAAGRRVGHKRRPYWSAPPCEGWVVEVFEQGGMVLWQTVRAKGTAYSIAESWTFPGYAVLVTGPGDHVKDVVSGGDLLDEWESVWPMAEDWSFWRRVWVAGRTR